MPPGVQRVPWRLRQSLRVRLRGPRRGAYVSVRFGIRVAHSIPPFFVDLDGRPFGRHLSPFVWFSKGSLDGKARGPLFGRVSSGPHRVAIFDTHARWSTVFTLEEGEALVVFVRAHRSTDRDRDAIRIRSVVVDRRGNVVRQVR